MQIEYEEIDSEKTPLGTLTLRRYRAETGEVGYEVAIDGRFLMASHGAHSERAMARLAHERLQRPAAGLTVLVGGLGAGHTLRAALDLDRVERIVVAEIGAKVVEWNRRYFAEINGGAVDDPRVEVRVQDLADILADADQEYDLLLLDVDNGPGWLAAEGNEALYDEGGVRACLKAMRPGGVCAVWSPQANPRFRETLQRVLADVEEIDTLAMGKAIGEPGDVIYLFGRAMVPPSRREP